MKKERITYEFFEKLDLRVGKVISARKLPGTKNLILLNIDFTDETRDVVVGMAQYYEPEYFIGKELPVLLNLEPRKFMGFWSGGMVLAADAGDKPVLLLPEKELKPGSIIK